MRRTVLMSDSVSPGRRVPVQGVSTALATLLLLAVLVSVVHYADNYFNYDAFPVATSAPTPSRSLVGLSWFGFTALAVLALVLLTRQRETLGAVCLALYSGSGLVGIGHYTVPGAADMPWWRQAHVIADVICGAAILGFAIWTLRRPQ